MERRPRIPARVPPAALLAGLVALWLWPALAPALAAGPRHGRTAVPVATATDGDVASAAAAVFDVRRFGARGDGRHDDTAAVRRALAAAAAAGGTVYFPAGTYRVRSLHFPPGVTLVGDGAGKSWLRGRLTADALQTVSRLRLGAPGRAFHLATGTHDTVFSRCRFVGGGGVADGQDHGVIRLDAHSARDVTFARCVVGRNSRDGNGVCVAETPWGHYERIVFRECRFRPQPRMAFECIQRGGVGYRDVNLIGCTFAATDGQAVSYDKGGWSRVEGCTFEGAGARAGAPWPYQLEVNRCQGMVVTGNVFWSARGAFLNVNGLDDAAAAPGASVVFSGNRFRRDLGVRHDPRRPWFIVGGSGVLFADNVVSVGKGTEVFYVHGPGNRFTANVVRVRATARPGMSVAFLEGAPATVYEGNEVVAPGAHVTVRRGSYGAAFLANTFVTGLDADELFRVEPGLTVVIEGHVLQ
jgi:hypothetical protein